MVVQLNWEPLKATVKESPPGILDGKAVSVALLEQIKAVVTQFKERGVAPKLSVVQVGGDVASSIYIRHKVRACERVGIEGQHLHFPEEISFRELREQLRKLNEDRSVHGVLLQLPLPEGMEGTEALLSIAPEKDVDGFHPVNLGGLMAGRALLEPCTPTGVMTLLAVSGVRCVGKEALVIGRSVIVGRPMSLMLTRANATVTICHRHTADLETAVRRADIVVVATGVPGLVRGDWIKEGAVIVDVGISRVDGRLKGDVEFEQARERASMITPVPGGVGPMTVATLMENTLRATCIQEGFVVRNGELLSVEEARVHFQTVTGLGLTRLRPGAPK